MPAMIPPETQQKVLRLANGGMSQRQIHEMVGIARGTVQSILLRGYVKYVSDIYRNPENEDNDGLPLDGKVVEAMARQRRKARGNSTFWDDDHRTTLDLNYDRELGPRYEEARKMMMERDRIERPQIAEVLDD